MSSFLRHPLLYVFLFALFLRLLFLGVVPGGFTPDEVSQGYSAYSLLKTGLDEWGEFPIFSFKSFLDYKAPLLTWLMVPSIAVFGLNEFAVRFPSAIFGALAVIPLYFLARLLFESAKLFPSPAKGRAQGGVYIGFLSAFLLAISPWHLQFSRMALEANLISFFFPLGLYFLIKSLDHPKFLPLSALVFSISLYSYHAAKLFIPLFVITFLLVNIKKVQKILPSPAKGRVQGEVLVTILIVFILVFPLFINTLFSKTGSRGADLSISNLSLTDLNLIKSEQYYSPLGKLTPILPRIFSNKFTFFLDKFSENYLSYMSPAFWFATGGWETTYSIIPGRGLLYIWQFPFVSIALAYLGLNLLKGDISSKALFLWLFLAPLPASITKEGYRPNRASAFLGLFELLTAMGIVLVFNYLKPKLSTINYRLATLLFTVSCFLFTAFYFHDYYVLTPIKFPDSLSFGYRASFAHIAPIQDQYSRILISKGTQSQSLAAFYLQIDPREFQKATPSWQQKINARPIQYLDQMDHYSLGKLQFKELVWPEDADTDTLYLAQSYAFSRLPDDRRTLYTVLTPDQKPLLDVFDFRTP